MTTTTLSINLPRLPRLRRRAQEIPGVRVTVGRDRRHLMISSETRGIHVLPVSGLALSIAEGDGDLADLCNGTEVLHTGPHGDVAALIDQIHATLRDLLTARPPLTPLRGLAWGAVGVTLLALFVVEAASWNDEAGATEASATGRAATENMTPAVGAGTPEEGTGADHSRVFIPGGEGTPQRAGSGLDELRMLGIGTESLQRQRSGIGTEPLHTGPR